MIVKIPPWSIPDIHRSLRVPVKADASRLAGHHVAQPANNLLFGLDRPTFSPASSLAIVKDHGLKSPDGMSIRQAIAHGAELAAIQSALEDKQQLAFLPLVGFHTVEELGEMLGQSPARVHQKITDITRFQPSTEGISSLVCSLLLVQELFGLNPREIPAMTPLLAATLSRELLYAWTFGIERVPDKVPMEQLAQLLNLSPEGVMNLIRDTFGLSVADPEAGISEPLVAQLLVPKLFGLDAGKPFLMTEEFDRIYRDEIDYLLRTGDRSGFKSVSGREAAMGNKMSPQALYTQIEKRFGLPPLKTPEHEYRLADSLLDYLDGDVIPPSSRNPADSLPPLPGDEPEEEAPVRIFLGGGYVAVLAPRKRAKGLTPDRTNRAWCRPRAPAPGSDKPGTAPAFRVAPMLEEGVKQLIDLLLRWELIAFTPEHPGEEEGVAPSSIPPGEDTVGFPFGKPTVRGRAAS